MNEVVETIYQWHKGMNIQHISLSLGIDRKRVRKYLGMALDTGYRDTISNKPTSELIHHRHGIESHKGTGVLLLRLVNWLSPCTW